MNDPNDLNDVNDPRPAASLRARTAARVGTLVQAVRQGDGAMVQDAVMRLSRSRRWLAPLGLVVSAFVMLFDGLKLLVSNWRLTLVQLLPAMWIWLAMFDLKVHVLHGHSFRIVHGALLLVVMLAIVAGTAASFFLNAVFGFAIGTPGPPEIRPAVREAWAHRAWVLAWGAAVGVLLALSTMVVSRWGGIWFALSLSIVVGLMMFCYVTVPARLIGVGKPQRSRRDRIATAVVGGTISFIVCTPPYLLARLGLLMLGSALLRVPGVALVVVGFALQAGATSSVKAIKMSATLVGGQPDADGDAGADAGAPPSPAV